MSKTLGSLPVGTLIKDTASKYYGAPIVWKIADQNHKGYPANSTTLITDKIIKIAGFDGIEANNADSDRRSAGSNRYRTSNLRQWLNSFGTANSWWTAQNLTDGTANTNNHDAPPTTANMYNYNGYDTEKGFLTNFSVGFRTAMLETTLTVAKNTMTDGGSSETVKDKIFLASTTEVGFANENNIAEGSKLAIFSDDNSRLANPTAEAVSNNTFPLSALGPWFWWLRTPSAGLSHIVRGVNKDGSSDFERPYRGSWGIRPLCNLNSEILVSDEPDSDGAYVLEFSQITLNDVGVGDFIKIKENGEDINYLIVHKGLPSSMYDVSCDGVWLLREQAHSNQVWDADNKSDYENSDIHAWLNGTFLNTVDEKIRAAIKMVKIPFKKGVGYASTPVQSGSNGLSCKVFLLSGYEVGLTQTDNQYFPIDGAKLSYFSDNNSRICKDSSNSAVSWWLRSPFTNVGDSVFAVGPGGTYGHNFANSTGCAARPALVLPSNLLIDSDGNLSTNTLPTITSDKTGDLGTLTEGFTCNYSVDDADADDAVTVSLYIDDTQIDAFEAVKGQQYTYTLEGNDWLKVINGQHTFTITTSDGKDTVESAATFARNCTRLSTTLGTPLPANDTIAACTLKVAGSIPGDAVCKFEVTNNANDIEPVWEDCTAKSKAGLSYVFQNKTAENGFAFNFRVSIERGASGDGGYITQISGGYE